MSFVSETKKVWKLFEEPSYFNLPLSLAAEEMMDKSYVIKKILIIFNVLIIKWQLSIYVQTSTLFLNIYQNSLYGSPVHRQELSVTLDDLIPSLTKALVVLA